MQYVKNVAAWIIIIGAGLLTVYFAGKSDTVRSALLMIVLAYLMADVYITSKVSRKLDEVQQEYSGMSNILEHLIQVMEKQQKTEGDIKQLEERWETIESSINK